jgi:hypothetical protein
VKIRLLLDHLLFNFIDEPSFRVVQVLSSSIPKRDFAIARLTKRISSKDRYGLDVITS